MKGWNLSDMPRNGHACEWCGMPAICFIVHPDKTRHPHCGRPHVDPEGNPIGSMLEFS